MIEETCCCLQSLYQSHDPIAMMFAGKPNSMYKKNEVVMDMLLFFLNKRENYHRCACMCSCQDVYVEVRGRGKNLTPILLL